MTRHGRSIACLLAACGLVVACRPTTDRARYEPGETGSATFQNPLSTPVHLGGCGHFEYERRVGDAWVGQGSDIACIWEGFAEPVAPGGVVVDPLVAREPGRWRLRYAVGLGCSERQPLSACPVIEEITSAPFEVVASGCVVTGCSSHVCAEDHVATTCEWLPHYACYRDARCGRFGPGGRCAWEPTAELALCIDEQGGPLPPPPSR
jgi:hypothetical protein